jgi:hypothetical protein
MPDEMISSAESLLMVKAVIECTLERFDGDRIVLPLVSFEIFRVSRSTSACIATKFPGLLEAWQMRSFMFPVFSVSVCL